MHTAKSERQYIIELISFIKKIKNTIVLQTQAWMTVRVGRYVKFKNQLPDRLFWRHQSFWQDGKQTGNSSAQTIPSQEGILENRKLYRWTIS